MAAQRRRQRTNRNCIIRYSCTAGVGRAAARVLKEDRWMNRTLLVPTELAEPRTSVSGLAFSEVADFCRLVLVAIVLAPAMIAATEVELRWDELSPMITGKE